MIRDEVHLRLKDERLATFSVFVPMVAGDGEASAVAAAKRLAKAGIPSYWDGERRLGGAYAKVVELPRGRKVAWDIYFVYGPDATWGEAPPRPAYWMHQLAMDERCLDPAKLRKAIKTELDKMKPSKRLVFLTRNGCSGTALMRQSLDAALKGEKGWSYEVVDLATLPKGDPRKGYPTPTVLKDGKDLFGMPEPKGGADAPG